MKSRLGVGNKASSRNRIGRSFSTALWLGIGAARFVFPFPRSHSTNPHLPLSLNLLSHLPPPINPNTQFLSLFRSFPHAHPSLLPFFPHPHHTHTHTHTRNPLTSNSSAVSLTTTSSALGMPCPTMRPRRHLRLCVIGS